MPIVQTDKKLLCRTCGADITSHAKYTRWTQCSVCYWKGRFERCEPLAELQRKLGEIRARLSALADAVPQAKQSLEEYRAMLNTATPWFKKLLGPPTDPTLEAYAHQYYTLEREQFDLPSQLRRIQYEVEAAKKAKKRLVQAEMARIAAEGRHRKAQDEHNDYTDKSTHNLANSFDRSHFLIQPKDYRRGNAIDNYCRGIVGEAILAAFEQKCAFCSGFHDLTFDHYGLTKNEGGNFVLISSDESFLRINVVVLCRACNSMKGQRSYLHFFDDTRRTNILECHKRFLASVLSDERFLKLLKKWGGQR